MNLLELLNISNEEQKGFGNLKEYLRLNKAIYHFIYCMNKQADELDNLTNDPAFRLSRLTTTLIFLKNCIENRDIAEIKSVENFCKDFLTITNFNHLADLLNYVLKTEVSYIDEKLMGSIEKIIIETVSRTAVGAHYNSENNEFTFDDISCNNLDTQHLFDKNIELYHLYKNYNFPSNRGL
ncbi:MAG: hypothetical protein GKC53_00130 [Neisseriaceae bacterium]|nr:MAG: hypothetical protein GKC53_00130 [Neisseriaceae bacterium]